MEYLEENLDEWLGEELEVSCLPFQVQSTHWYKALALAWTASMEYIKERARHLGMHYCSCAQVVTMATYIHTCIDCLDNHMCCLWTCRLHFIIAPVQLVCGLFIFRAMVMMTT